MILAAGPVVNLVQAGLCARMGYDLLAGAGLILGLLNLLPIGPLDGGGLLRLLCQFLLGPWAGERAAGVVSLVFLGGLVYGGWVLLVRANGTPALLLFALWLFFFTISSFFPCHFSLPHVK
jgi:stage IV sporulation protein FB